MTTRNRIDWNLARQHVAASQAALERLGRVDPVELQAILKRRAKRLAMRRIDEAHRENRNRILVFTLADEQYGIPLQQVVEVQPFENCTPLPTASAELSGIVSLHGAIHSVVDLRILLEMPPASAESRGYLIVVKTSSDSVALRVDQVERVTDITDAELASLDDLSRTKAVTHGDDGTRQRLILLNCERILLDT